MTTAMSPDAQRLAGLLVARRDEVLDLARVHHLDVVGVFGSVARGTAGPDSDLDLVVSSAAGRGLAGASDQVEFQDALADLLDIGVDVVDEAGLERSQNRFRREILHQVVRL